MTKLRPALPRRLGAALAASLLLATWACSDTSPQPPAPTAATRCLLVVGIDGAEWRVIRDLWQQGRLPHLQQLAQRGVSAQLRTNYGASPVIWTTIATGMLPTEHGITDFVVPTEQGDVPVSSSVRRVPAIWNMVSRAGSRVAVLGWWASWPAESVRGVVVSDRATLPELAQRVYPPALQGRLDAEIAAAREEPNPFIGNPATRLRDQVMARLGAQMMREEYELVLVYFRGVDIASHNYWKYYQPAAFPEQDLRGEPELAEIIPREYEAVDQALGALLAAAPPETDVVVISDHGFRPARPEIVKVFLDFDRVLAHLGYLEREDHRADLAKSQLYSYASPDFQAEKWLRFRSGLTAAERARLRRQLTADLERITYRSGARVFAVRDPRPGEARRAIDLVVDTLLPGASQELLLDGDPHPLAGTVSQVSRVSGSHGQRTHGIFLAAGPNVNPAAKLEGIRIQDVTPTLLYGLGLPVAKNFAGQPWPELFRDEFRRRYPLRTIAAWPGDEGGEARPSAADDELVRELRALGYL